MAKTLYVMRGAPGSGKSTVADLIVSRETNKCEIASTDAWFTTENGYEFDARNLNEAHFSTYMRFLRIIQYGRSVVLDNTNIKVRDFAHYVAAALVARYRVVEILCVNEYQNTHGVPEAKVKQMRRELEVWPMWLPCDEFYTSGEWLRQNR